jgi:hypothetical protein
VHAGPPGFPTWGTIASLSPNPAGVQREGRSEIRSPMEQALSPLKARIAGPGRGGDPRRFLSHGTQVQGQLAAWTAGYGREFRSPLEQGSPGRGRVPSRLLSPGTQVHGQLAARAASMHGWDERVPNSEAHWSKRAQGEAGDKRERTQAQRSSSCKAWPRPGRHRRGSNPRQLGR